MYDVLIVGAGSAGCAIAARVSEDPNLSVGLVEAGPDYPDLASTPFDLVNSHNNSYRAHDWGFSYSPTAQRSDRFPRGRVTGGSSAVNTAIALRGVPEDYDEWASLGCAGWGWRDVLPAFKRLERDLDYPDAPYHGDAGPISIRRYPHDELLPQHQAFLASAQALDYPSCPDGNDPDGWGAGPQPMNKLGRLRISAAVGYLAPARIRPNLDIHADTLVRRLVIEKHRCVGVEVETRHETSRGRGGNRQESGSGEVRILRANLVVLSAGALMTPPILWRSGIGDRAEVEQLGVDTVAHLPGVGRNLSDHPAISVMCEVQPGVPVDPDEPIIQTILRYTAEGSDKRNDLQIEQISFAGRPDSPPQFLIAAVLEYQYGRGELRLADSDPYTAPQMYSRFCEDERDADRLAKCMADTLRFTSTGPLADMVAAVRFPDLHRGDSHEDLMKLCRKFSGSGYHPCGTAKMGDASDPMAVVDALGRVRNVEHLVIADASIMPFVPRANTNLTCLMIGEHIGEKIRTQPGEYGR